MQLYLYNYKIKDKSQYIKFYPKLGLTSSPDNFNNNYMQPRR